MSKDIIYNAYIGVFRLYHYKRPELYLPLLIKALPPRTQTMVSGKLFYKQNPTLPLGYLADEFDYGRTVVIANTNYW